MHLHVSHQISSSHRLSESELKWSHACIHNRWCRISFPGLRCEIKHLLRNLCGLFPRKARDNFSIDFSGLDHFRAPCFGPHEEPEMVQSSLWSGIRACTCVHVRLHTFTTIWCRRSALLLLQSSSFTVTVLRTTANTRGRGRICPFRRMGILIINNFAFHNSGGLLKKWT